MGKISRRKLFWIGTTVAEIAAVGELLNVLIQAHTLPPSDHKNFVISLYSEQKDNYNGYLRDDANTLGGAADISQTHGNNEEILLSEIANDIEKQIKKYGKLKHLAISGDADTNFMSCPAPIDANYNGTYYIIDGQNRAPVSTKNILKRLLSSQDALKEQSIIHGPLAEDITFLACDVVANLSQDDADFYSEMSVKLGTPIRAAYSRTNNIATTPDFAYFIQFNPDGTLSTPDINNPFGYNITNILVRSSEDPVAQGRWIEEFRRRHHQSDTPSPTAISQQRHTPSEESLSFAPQNTPQVSRRGILKLFFS